MSPGTNNLYLIDLDLPALAFRKFISSWVLISKDGAVVVDPGPSSTLPQLTAGLKELGVQHLSAVLLTHIHIDHAGGTGDLLDHFPGTPVLCHEKGIQHLADPGQLWEGSLKVLGDLAKAYGPIKAVPRKLLFYAPRASFAEHDFTVLDTPGHARHHLSFVTGDLLFAGEALGVSLPGEPLYRRMATPPVFRYNDFMESIGLLSRCDVKTVCFAHYGLSNKPEEAFEGARNQLNLWMNIAEEYRTEEEVLRQILKKDPMMKRLESFPRDIRDRELHFLGNSVKGITQSLEQGA